MSVTVSGTGGITFNDASVQNTSAFYGGLAMRNRIINGAMVIDQRNAGASVSIGPSTFIVDRFKAFRGGGSATISGQQSTTAPVGFTNSVVLTVGTGAAPAATDYTHFDHNIEGFNVADLGWGTANAQAITLSFWVRSSLTGTFGVAFRNDAGNRSYIASYAISAANTWEYKTVTIAGDTSGTWLTNNSAGIKMTFDIGVGTTYSNAAGSWAGANYFGLTGGVKLAATSGATFYITGVQLEKGSTATSFDYRPYSTELALCQRYYYRTSGSVNTVISTSAVVNAATTARVNNQFPVTMRAEPTALSQSGAAGDYILNYGGAQQTCSAVPAFLNANTQMASADFTVASGLTTGNSAYVRCANTNSFLAWSAEL